MGNKKGIIIMVVCFVVLLAVAGLLYDKLGQGMGNQPLAQNPTQQADLPEAEQEAQPQAEMAPDFTVYDREGNPVKLSDLRGKPVVVNFWATWCGYCVSEMPEFQQVWEELGEDVHFMMVNQTDGITETKEEAEAHLEEAGYTFPVYFDTELSASRAYSVRSLPVTYFIDAEGKGVAYAMGAIDTEVLKQGIEMVLPQ